MPSPRGTRLAALSPVLLITACLPYHVTTSFRSEELQQEVQRALRKARDDAVGRAPSRS